MSNDDLDHTNNNTANSEADSSARDRAILTSVGIVPEGSVVSYGYIANSAGYPGRARLVGKLLRDLPCDTRIPWHRVLRADRRIAFLKGSKQYRLQRERLLNEGVLLNQGRVSDEAFLG